jgi:hypothetical protein
VLLFATLLGSIRLPAVQLISSLASVILGIAVTLLLIARVSWAPLTFGCWFFASLLSYLLVRLVLQKEFETASLRASVLLLTAHYWYPQQCCFSGGSATLAELAVVGAIAVGAAYAAHRSSALGGGLVEVILLFHFLLLTGYQEADCRKSKASGERIRTAIAIVKDTIPEPLCAYTRPERLGHSDGRRRRMLMLDFSFSFLSFASSGFILPF